MLKALIPAAILIVAAMPAEAACTQANIAGTWTAYSIGLDSGQLAWVSCNLVIDTAGAFSAGTSTCTASGQTANAQGSLKLSAVAKCRYTGSLTIVQASHTDPIPSLTLSLDKQTASGVGAQNGSGNVFVFNMVKTQ
jgi:hypothetical protein